MVASTVNDPYKRLDYRRLIAWPKRIERESPFLQDELRQAPDASVVDLGCGTGEHARHLAEKGFRAVGIDRSDEQIEAAREFEGEFGDQGPSFLCGEIAELATLTEECFGAAICLGNVLPHLDDEGLARALASPARLLAGGRLLIQLVNYERLLTSGDRHLPVNVRDDPEGDGEIVFLRLVKADGERHVRFFPSTLVLCPGREPPLEIRASKEVRLRAWRLAELESALSAGGFRVVGAYGDMAKSVFDARESSDLIVSAVLDGGSSAAAI